MRLIPIQATETKPQSIDLYTDNNNKFATIDKCGKIFVYGEDAFLEIEEIRDILKIADNFELFFKNIKTQ